ncbi:hypothetical protein INT43_004074 [Umbelopsis isabellina]|uniref:LysM domain-containing protein n=1 Tax=Mortierella isabellina TaxID=91625 RepID=A0A8H7PV27_MORIS|nr:hypothetical protein INT43_004074 [Umbelopsis isabellina]
MKLLSLIALSSFAATAFANGPAPGCLQTYTVKPTDGCESIAASFSLTPDEFYNMNPGLHHAGDHVSVVDILHSDGSTQVINCVLPIIQKTNTALRQSCYCVCMKKPCAQAKDATTPSASVTSAAPSVKSVVTTPAASSMKSASVAASVVPSAMSSAVSGSASMPATGSAAASSGNATSAGASASTSPSAASSASSTEKLASSVAVIALLAGAASVFAM